VLVGEKMKYSVEIKNAHFKMKPNLKNDSIFWRSRAALTFVTLNGLD
jgi:hypothetical protein